MVDVNHMPHIHEKIDFTVDVFIVHGRRVLLRMHEKYHVWLAPGGHIELDEDPNQAAIREVEEEVGLAVRLWEGAMPLPDSDDRVSMRIPPVSINRHHVSPAHEHVSLVYFATTTDNRVVVRYEADRSDEWKWFTGDELDDFDIPENIRTYARLALRTLQSNDPDEGA